MAEPHSTANREASGAEHELEHENEPQRVSTTYRRLGWGIGNESSSIVRDDAWSCFAVIFTFWFFVSVTMILGVYGSMNLSLGPDSSIVFQPSPLFVQYVKVENLEAKPGPMLYGTYRYPPLDVVATWSETRNVSIPTASHKEWKYYLNKGSEVNISYSLSSGSSSIFLVIVEGMLSRRDFTGFSFHMCEFLSHGSSNHSSFITTAEEVLHSLYLSEAPV